MSDTAIEYQGDKKRLEQSLLISLLFWLILVVLLAFIPIRSSPVTEQTMNPVYIELTEVPEVEQEPSPRAGSMIRGASVSEPAKASESAAPALSASAASPVRSSQTTESAPATVQASRASAQNEAPSQTSLPLNQGATPARRAATASNPYQGRGGEDPFAPLSEEDLAAQNPASPALPSGPAQSPGTASGSAPPQGQKTVAVPADSLAQRVQSTTETLGQGGSSGAYAATGGGTRISDAASGQGQTGKTGAGTGPSSTGGLQGSLDFGEGPGRRLISAPQTQIPAKLLEGQPTQMETEVRFRIDKGGAVIALSIQFDPPLPLDIAEYLKTYVFSRWVFSSANSDGQVRFKYSIKVR